MKIPFEKKYRKKYYSLLNEIFESNFLSDGPKNQAFAKKFGEMHKMHASTISGGGPGLLALLDYVNVSGHDVIVPTNTFIATPMAVKKAGGNVIFADCKREDLCIGVENIKDVLTPNTKAVIVVHIGGHLAFDIEKIADYCKQKGLYLIEDCAHAHGASYKGKFAGSYGIGGSYSFYSTKTIPIGSGGMVVSKYKEVIDFVDKYKIYGKNEKNEITLDGFNYRMSEIEAALGLIQLDRFYMILKWKRNLANKLNKIFIDRVKLPAGMQSGYYKYIVFTPIKEYTGPVYNMLCHEIWKQSGNFPNSEWLKNNHWCAPIYYGWDGYNLSIQKIKKRLITNQND